MFIRDVDMCGFFFLKSNKIEFLFSVTFISDVTRDSQWLNITPSTTNGFFIPEAEFNCQEAKRINT